MVQKFRALYQSKSKTHAKIKRRRYSIDKMKFSILPLTILTLGCASPHLQRDPNAVNGPKLQVPNRDERMDKNKAFASVKSRPGKPYQFKDVKQAFPDNGKNMLVKERAIAKNAAKKVIDNSPWRHQIYDQPLLIEKDRKRFSNLNRGFYETPISESEAFVLAQQSKRSPASDFYYSVQIAKNDDLFSPNHHFENAFSLVDSENLWIGLQGSEGVQWSDDYYKIWVSPQYRQLVLDLRYQHYLGDVDLQLFDSQKRLIASSQRNTEDEFINIQLSKPGFYFVKVFGANLGNRYDFKYTTQFTGSVDDEYEENDTLEKAFDLRPFEGKWLSEVRGEGISADNDYFKILVKSTQRQVIVDLRVLSNKGDIDVKLLDSTGKLVASSSHTGDDDYIDFRVPQAGIYFLKIYPFHLTDKFNMYDLKWTTSIPTSR